MGAENRGAGRRWATKCARTYPPFGTPFRSCLAVHASPRIGYSAPGIWDLGSLIEGLAHGHGARAAPTRLGR
jgi:hypothetical protein